MGRQGDKAREALMDAAEELFAQHGIDAVSNRRITEHAGTANHSAIKYHFGGRDELLRALIDRALAGMHAAQRDLPPLQASSRLREAVMLHVLPWVYHFGSLPAPAWRAQFLFKVRGYPDLPAIVAESVAEGIMAESLRDQVRSELEGIPEQVLKARAGILGQLLLGLCSEYERQHGEGASRGSWESVGYFLVDSIVGMLGAPSTSPADFLST